MVLEGQEGRHATRTLRLKAGDGLELCDGQGQVVRAEVAEVQQRGGAELRTTEEPVTVSKCFSYTQITRLIGN